MRRNADPVIAVASRIALLFAALTVSSFSLSACSKKEPPSASVASGGSSASTSPGAGPVDGSAGASSREAWIAAGTLAPDDLARLALREGSAGLVSGAATPERRRLAVHALAFGEDLEALPLLGEVAGGGDAELALVAAESAVTLAARPRPSVDPEDAIEVREGCDRLRAVANDKEKPKLLRIKIARALRMLEDRGCARDLPKIE